MAFFKKRYNGFLFYETFGNKNQYKGNNLIDLSFKYFGGLDIYSLSNTYIDYNANVSHKDNRSFLYFNSNFIENLLGGNKYFFMGDSSIHNLHGYLNEKSFAHIMKLSNNKLLIKKLVTICNVTKVNIYMPIFAKFSKLLDNQSNFVLKDFDKFLFSNEELDPQILDKYRSSKVLESFMIYLESFVINKSTIRFEFNFKIDQNSVEINNLFNMVFKETKIYKIDLPDLIEGLINKNKSLLENLISNENKFLENKKIEKGNINSNFLRVIKFYIHNLFLRKSFVSFFLSGNSNPYYIPEILIRRYKEYYTLGNNVSSTEMSMVTYQYVDEMDILEILKIVQKHLVNGPVQTKKSKKTNKTIKFLIDYKASNQLTKNTIKIFIDTFFEECQKVYLTNKNLSKNTNFFNFENNKHTIFNSCEMFEILKKSNGINYEKSFILYKLYSPCIDSIFNNLFPRQVLKANFKSAKILPVLFPQSKNMFKVFIFSETIDTGNKSIDILENVVSLVKEYYVF